MKPEERRTKLHEQISKTLLSEQTEQVLHSMVDQLFEVEKSRIATDWECIIFWFTLGVLFALFALSLVGK